MPEKGIEPRHADCDRAPPVPAASARVGSRPSPGRVGRVGEGSQQPSFWSRLLRVLDVGLDHRQLRLASRLCEVRLLALQLLGPNFAATWLPAPLRSADDLEVGGQFDRTADLRSADLSIRAATLEVAREALRAEARAQQRQLEADPSGEPAAESVYTEQLLVHRFFKDAACWPRRGRERARGAVRHYPPHLRTPRPRRRRQRPADHRQTAAVLRRQGWPPAQAPTRYRADGPAVAYARENRLSPNGLDDLTGRPTATANPRGSGQGEPSPGAATTPRSWPVSRARPDWCSRHWNCCRSCGVETPTRWPNTAT